VRFADFLKDQNIIAPRHFIKEPIVSVIMPTYCRAHDDLLSQAITGVLSQTLSDFEFIILDDGSIDGSEDIIRDFQRQDDRILYVRHKINSGLPALRVDEGILLSKGDYIAFQFDDDNWSPYFLQNVMREAMKRNKAFVHCQAKFLIGANLFSPSFPIMQPTHASLLQRNTIANVSALLHKSVFKNCGLYDPHVVLRRLTDWDLWLRIAKQDPPYLVPEVLVRVQAGLSDSIGTLAPLIEYEDFLHIFHVYRDVDLTPERIMDTDVNSLDKYIDKMPLDALYRFYNNLIVPWLKQHEEQFVNFGFAIQDIQALDAQIHSHKLMGPLKNQIKKFIARGSRFSGIIRKIIKRVLQHFPRLWKFFLIPSHVPFFMMTYWNRGFHDMWHLLPLSFMELKSDPLIVKYRHDGFLLKKSANLQHCYAILYSLTVQGGSLYTLSLAFQQNNNDCNGSVGIEAICLEDKSISRAITIVSNVSERVPTTFFFEPPLKAGKYYLRIFGKHLRAPIYVYELYKYKWIKIIKRPFCRLTLV
jgi:glycosyltransferase involved in cell wall biosynthesis